MRYSLFILLFVLFSCEESDNDRIAVEPIKGYQTENVIIVVVDGPRYSETWGDSTHQHQPRLAKDLAKHGVVCTNFYNNGVTFTNPGHTAITTGNYQQIDNGGNEIPDNPSIFQFLRKHTEDDSSKTWIIASKDKLQILANTKDSTWNDAYMPSTNCGVNGAGIGNGYRDDSLTFIQIERILVRDHPKLVLINFKEPDGSGHSNNWAGYLKGIEDTDEYVFKIWNLIENDSIYKGKTALFVTNDHGRHLDGHLDGFISHGDSCMGCRHINLFAIGPDFKNGAIVNIKREQIDISATVAELFGIDFDSGKGEVMDELFR